MRQSDVFLSVRDTVPALCVCVSKTGSREKELISKENPMLLLLFSWRGRLREFECSVEYCHCLCTLL